MEVIRSTVIPGPLKEGAASQERSWHQASGGANSGVDHAFELHCITISASKRNFIPQNLQVYIRAFITILA